MYNVIYFGYTTGGEWSYMAVLTGIVDESST